MTRRELIWTLAAPLAGNAAEYQPRAMSVEQYRALDQATEAIIPADSTGPGARAAGVCVYIDTWLLYQDSPTKALWTTHLITLADHSIHDQLTTWARNEANPSTDGERFFVALKALTTDAFSFSEKGSQQFWGYKGNSAHSTFHGCDSSH